MSGRFQFPRELWQTFEQLYPLRRYFVSPDYDQALELLGRHLDLRIHRFEPGKQVNRWVIPPGWQCKRATISRGGRCLYDGTEHALRVIALSTSFEGRVSRDELREHLHFDARHHDWVPWHFRQLYRPWERTWGFCVPKTFYDALEPGRYDVLIETDEYPGALKVADSTLPGRRAQTIVLVAHLDHPQMANDDLAGVMVGVRLMQLLGQQPRQFSYRLVIVQELIGSEYYLARMADTGEIASFFGSLFLEMLGSATPLALQRSHGGTAALERALEQQLKSRGLEHRIGAFRMIIGNDEINWESYGVPMTSLSRFPYPEYHSDRDNLSIISPERLEQSAQLVLAALEQLESERWYSRSFRGCPCTSHPDYDLYIDPGQPAFGSQTSEQTRRLRMLMDAIPIELAKPASSAELAERFVLRRDVVDAYLLRWVEKGLLNEL